jgi:hypothetical protein
MPKIVRAVVVLAMAVSGLGVLAAGPALANQPTCQTHTCPPSPIIIDVGGGGFHLTSPADGVRFDFYGNGHPIKMAWIAPGSSDAFLVLPQHGRVTDGAELFGNLTPQPPAADANGFLALASLNTLTGGHTQGVIDSSDPIYARLRLWQFTSHDGVVGAGRLSTLPQLGIKAIYLNFHRTSLTDRYGNQFRYVARVVSTNPRAGKYAYDVFFATPAAAGGARPATAPARHTTGTSGLLALFLLIPVGLLLALRPTIRRRRHQPAGAGVSDTRPGRVPVP